MIARLPDELSQALGQGDGGPLSVEDERTRQRYVIVDEDTHRRAMKALWEQQVLEAIQEGIADMEAGRMHTTEEVDMHIRAKLGFPPRKRRHFTSRASHL